MTRRLLHPLVLVTLMALLLLMARMAGAQRADHLTASGVAPRRVAVAMRALSRGTVLDAGDFEYRDTTAIRGVADTTAVATGWVTRRVIAAGEVLREPAVVPPVIVTANDPVEAIWQDHNVRLTIRAIATRNGAMGDRVTVRTEQGRRMDGTVIGPGRVRIE